MENLSDYDYVLPEELIAQTPLVDRAASRLLHLSRADGSVAHRHFREVPEILREGDLLVVNDTQVSAVRLFGAKPTGAEVEVLLLREFGPRQFEALVRPGKRLQVGARVEFEEGLSAVVEAVQDEGLRTLRFDEVEGFGERLQKIGNVPLPPYIHQQIPNAERYNTVYAAQKGSGAAPTAGLHFTPAILDALQARGVEMATVTLHIGLDTFRPISVEDASRHVMHGETCVLPPETAAKVEACRGRVIAVGTTSVRTLESFAVGRRRVSSGEKVSTLYVRPGFEFQVVDGMFTNFHMPRTTMLLMVSALTGKDNLLNAYREAVRQKYRFLSFGDSMLVL